MKKLTKSSLAELAKQMPVLSESEQSTYIGGDIFIIDRNGYIVDTITSSTQHGLQTIGTGINGDSGNYIDLGSGVTMGKRTYNC